MSTQMKQGVPDGYKLTEVGVIPEDWEVCSIGQFSPFVTSGSRGWADFYSDYGDLFVRITNMKRDSIRLNLQSNRYVSLPELSSEGKRTSLENGDLLISITADIGIISYVDEYLPKPAYINQHIALVRFQNESINAEFISYYLASENVQRLFRGNTDQGAKAGINLGAIRDIKFALPVVGEQNAIVNAFSDIDSLITSLEKLIAKKRTIKTATMQQLLTGKKRLPPFDKSHTGYKKTELGEIPEDWDIYPFFDLVDIAQGQVNPRNDPYRNMVLIGPKHVESTTGKLLFTETAFEQGAISGKYIFQSGDVLYGKINPYLMKATLATSAGLCSADMYPLRPSEKLCSGFLLALVLGEDFTKYAVSVSARSGMPKINRKELSEYKFAAPKNIVEQQAIATVLQDVDADINILNGKLRKTHQLKQGMMQELLTGKTRLVAGEV